MAGHGDSFTDEYIAVEYIRKRNRQLTTYNQFRSDRIPMAGHSISFADKYITIEYIRKRNNKRNSDDK